MKYLFKTLLAFAFGAALLSSCSKEDGGAAEAVLASDSFITFATQNAPAHTITVYSDGDWTADTPSWATISPASGTGTVEGVTITVQDNIRDGAADLPRRDTIRIHGDLLRSYAEVVIYQVGDKYRGAATVDVSGLMSLSEGSLFVLNEARVVAVAEGMYVISDGTTNMIVNDASNVSVGDVISFRGTRDATSSIYPVKDIEDVTVTSSSTVTYPDPVDITGSLETYTSDAASFVSVDGVVVSGSLTVDGTAVVVTPVASGFDIASINGHKALFTGYYAGKTGDVVSMVLSSVEDKGQNMEITTSVLAKWAFTTARLSEYADNFGGTAGVQDKAEGDGGKFVQANESGNGTITFWQVDKSQTTPSKGNPKRIVGATGHPYVSGVYPGDYWLFTATRGSSIAAGTNVHVYFESRSSAGGQKYWVAEYYDGEWKPAYPLQTKNVNGEDISYNVEDACDGKTNAKIDVTFTLSTTVDDIQFRYRCAANWTGKDAAVTRPDGGTNRICTTGTTDEELVANSPVIEITESKVITPAVPVGGVIFSDDFEWLSTWTGEAGDAVSTNDPSASAPNVFTVSWSNDFLTEFTNRGYVYVWGDKASGDFVSTSEGNPNVMYLQKNYLKFGKTSWNAGIKLPALAGAGESSDATLEFDWCWHVTGAFKPDLMTLTVLAENGGSVSGGEAVSSSQSTTDGDSKIEWQHVSLNLTGVSSETVITIRPTNADPSASNTRKQNRWYLDNIKIVRVK